MMTTTSKMMAVAEQVALTLRGMRWRDMPVRVHASGSLVWFTVLHPWVGPDESVAIDVCGVHLRTGKLVCRIMPPVSAMQYTPALAESALAMVMRECEHNCRVLAIIEPGAVLS